MFELSAYKNMILLEEEEEKLATDCRLYSLKIY